MDSGIVWADPMIRLLVLWVGLAGATAASRQGKHIRIDFLKGMLPPKLENISQALVEIITAAICAAVAWHGVRFVRLEYVDGGNAFAQVPAWLCEAAIPLAFIVIACRYIGLAVVRLRNLFSESAS